jgi:acetyl esterase
LARFAGLQAPPQPVERVEEASYGPDPEQLLRIYVPAGQAPFPVALYFHGGGFVGGDLTVADEPARDMAVGAGILVVSATYRRAPEHRFPAAVDDAWAALEWTRANVAACGGDVTRIALTGDSAGGNLAAVTAVRARDEGAPVQAQVLIYPLTDPASVTPSKIEYAQGYVITAAALRWFGAQYADPQQALDPRLAVARTPSLAGLPPTLILTNECDAMRDEAETYGALLAAAGVDVTVRRFDGLVHTVYWMSGVVPGALEQRAAVHAFLRERLGAGVPVGALG